MKTMKYIGHMIMAAGMLTAISCSDFDDYNTVPSSVNSSANMTIWENISSNPQLSDFAEIIKKAGMDDELDAPTFYTVWAPLNGTYDASAVLAKDSDKVLKLFVQNHIASYNYPASGIVDEYVKVLNTKTHPFVGSGSYTFEEVAMTDQINLPSSNGIMHILNGDAPFYYNLYEYLSEGENIGLLSQYFKEYEYSVLDTKSSVIGPVVNGRQTYIDSVMTVYNIMADRVNAKLSDEDSTYTFIMPNDKAWESLYSKVSSCFNYASKTNYQVFDNNSESSKSVEVDAAFLKDSLSKRSIVNDLIFSNNNSYNRWLVDANYPSTDTLYSTSRSKLSNPEAILAQSKEKVKMSNGYAHIVDSVASYPWETYSPELKINAYRYLGLYASGSASYTSVTKPEQYNIGDFTEEGLSYLFMKASSAYSLPKITVQLPNVLSTTYNIYCVMVPPVIGLDNATEVKANYVKFKLNYATSAGTLVTEELGSFVNDTSKVDTILVGTFTFPVAYRGLGSDICPTLSVESAYTAFKKNEDGVYLRNIYTGDLRIAKIIMRPVEYDAYLKEN